MRLGASPRKLHWVQDVLKEWLAAPSNHWRGSHLRATNQAKIGEGSHDAGLSIQKSELVTCVAEVALGERDDFGGRYREHEGRTTTFVVKAAVARQELPSSVPLGGPRLGEAFEHVIVGELDGVALDHDVEPFVPVVAAGRQNHVRVPTKVHGLLFAGAGGEVDGPIEPHGNERSDVGATIGPDRRDPEQLGLLQHATRLIPSCGDCVRVAESRVDYRYWFVHQKNSFRLFSGGKVVPRGLSQGSRASFVRPKIGRSCSARRLPRGHVYRARRSCGSRLWPNPVKMLDLGLAKGP